MADAAPPKVLRSYRLVFRRRWRIFRIQGWRIPIPGGVELRLLGYWLACLGTTALAAKLPLLSISFGAVPPSLRLLALPLAAAWMLARWQVDGRPPHRALTGLIAWRLRPRHLAALRRCPPAGRSLAPLGELAIGPDLTLHRYPAGRLQGPVRVLLRYPISVLAGQRRMRLRPVPGAPPLNRGKTLELAPDQSAVFEALP